IPPGLLITWPLPGPTTDTCRLRLTGVPPLKVTDTVRALITVKVQLSPDSLPHPTHPPKSEKIVGVAVSVTVVPRAKVPLHGLPGAGAHLMPAGLLVIEPLPVPVLITLIRSNTAAPFTNVTVAVRAALRATVQT